MRVWSRFFLLFPPQRDARPTLCYVMQWHFGFWKNNVFITQERGHEWQFAIDRTTTVAKRIYRESFLELVVPLQYVFTRDGHNYATIISRSIYRVRVSVRILTLRHNKKHAKYNISEIYFLINIRIFFYNFVYYSISTFPPSSFFYLSPLAIWRSLLPPPQTSALS